MSRLALLGVAALLSVAARSAGHGSRGDLQPRLLCAVLSERQLPEQGSEQPLYRRLPIARYDEIRGRPMRPAAIPVPWALIPTSDARGSPLLLLLIAR